MTRERPYPGTRQAGRRQQGRLGLRERASEAGRGADFGLTPAPLETRVSRRAPVASHSSSYTHGGVDRTCVRPLHTRKWEMLARKRAKDLLCVQRADLHEGSRAPRSGPSF